MAFDASYVCNFKGVAEGTNFRLAPLTVFLGPNSSGKSSVIHALAALTQTVKLGDSTRRLVLDDEVAHVHLGRFIEIVHSKSYDDSIELGLSLGTTTFPLPTVRRSTAPHQISGHVKATYTFKSTLRTQEIYVVGALLEIGDRKIQFTKRGSAYRVTDSTTGKSFGATLQTNFFFELDWVSRPEQEWVDAMAIVRTIQAMVGQELRRTHYLGPFRRSPRRRYPFRGSTPVEVGPEGEAAVALLASEHLQSKKKPHFSEIARWLDTLGLATKLKVARVGSSDMFEVNLTLADNVSLPIADLGYGISQVLPVLAQCSFAKPGSTLLFEQPELHLHPGAAAKLARVFTEVVEKKNVTVVAETHSPDFFVEFIRQMNSGALKVSNVAAYDVKRDQKRSVYLPIPISKTNGHVEVEHAWAAGLKA